MPQPLFRRQCLVHLQLCGTIFFKLRHKGKHHRQRTPIRGADQRLQLHSHDARLVQTYSDRAPPQGRVRFIVGLHVGQHFVRTDIEGPKHHAFAVGGIQHATVKRGQLGPFRHLAPDQEL